uniref:Uncharacterized protein n=1 Tax=Nelumbo nucifera TaxID=4432 RepID=A0A822XMK4_NELNU|nr:TPA_asm: hypothetical protein HUJ06_023063 [Nelumbo nucifera]
MLVNLGLCELQPMSSANILLSFVDLQILQQVSMDDWMVRWSFECWTTSNRVVDGSQSVLPSSNFELSERRASIVRDGERKS